MNLPAADARENVHARRAGFLAERLANRFDIFAVASPWGEDKAPVAPATPFLERAPADRLKNRNELPEDLDPESEARRAGREALIVGHLAGEAAPPVFLAVRKKDGTFSTVGPGRYRVGFYTPAVDGTTKWACLDFDGAGHAKGHALADPLAAALETHGKARAVGLTAYLERSKSGKGYHLWILFAKPIAGEKARKLALAVVPKDAALATGGKADALHGKGIEVFPKSTGTETGSMVWGAWFHGAAPGANVFVQAAAGKLGEEYDPWTS